jgi:hypothetical protein
VGAVGAGAAAVAGCSDFAAASAVAAVFAGLVAAVAGCVPSSASAALEAAVRNNRTAVEVSSRSIRIPDIANFSLPTCPFRLQ